MKIKSGYFSSFLIATLSFAVDGCVETAAVKNQPRDSVRFATSVGAQIFYEAYITNNYTRPMSEHGYVSISVGATLPYRHSEYATDNVYFNAAVKATDANHDGVISDEEARQYSLSVRPIRKGLIAVSK